MGCGLKKMGCGTYNVIFSVVQNLGLKTDFNYEKSSDHYWNVVLQIFEVSQLIIVGKN